jgi:hypothetical protein
MSSLNEDASICDRINKITTYGVDRMVTNTSNGKIKKTSRGMRKHVRRMKEESRKAGIPINELKKKVRLQKVPKTKKEA